MKPHGMLLDEAAVCTTGSEQYIHVSGRLQTPRRDEGEFKAGKLFLLLTLQSEPH